MQKKIKATKEQGKENVNVKMKKGIEKKMEKLFMSFIYQNKYMYYVCTYVYIMQVYI